MELKVKGFDTLIELNEAMRRFLLNNVSVTTDVDVATATLFI